MKKLLSIILSVSMLVLLVGCGPQDNKASDASGEKTIKDTLTVVLSSEPVNLNPQVCNMLNAYVAEFLIYDTLLEKDADGNIVPNLATSWEMIDDTHIRFKLRDDVYFSNGEQMKASDVVYTISRCVNSPVTTSTYKFFDDVNTVAEDDFTVVIALKQPFAAVYSLLTHAYSSIVSESYVEKVGDDEAGLKPVGTGAYTLDKWTSGSALLLRRNDKYWGEKGASKFIELKVITESANRAIELETGAADIVLDVTTNDASRIEAAENLKLICGPSFRTTFIGLNLGKEETGNPKVREALAYALDIEALADAVYEQYGTVADSIMSNTVAGYKAIRKHEYNVEKAKALLAEAGYPNGITLSGRTQTIVEFKTIAEVVQNMWADAGIKAEIQVLDKATYSEKGKENGGTNITVTAQTATTGDAYQAIGTIFSTNSTSGIINSSDKDLEDMIEQASATYDDAERNELYAKTQDYIVNNYYAIPIAFTSIITGTANGVQNYVHSPANTPDLTYVYAYAK